MVSQENRLRNAVMNTLDLDKEIPSDNDIKNIIKVIANLMSFDGDINNIVNEIKVLINTRMGIGFSLVSKDAKHDPLWVDKREIDWFYAKAYKNFLLKEGWSPLVENTLYKVTEKLLGFLQDPLDEGSWSRRGLVIGNVQSGKTANYTGLIARAADAGYKFIIVIAGTQNELRRQTQARIDESFIGRNSDPSSNREIIGVALNGDYIHPITVTNIHDDFNKQTSARSGWDLGGVAERPIILVIKKNVSTLKYLHQWLEDMNSRQDGQITDVPLLMIDDEADNASINTNKEETDPTKTNIGIRKILKLFEKSAYVGYTATPFANIFIDPKAYDENLSEDLFPRDFIYCLEAPDNYFGAEKVFGVSEEDPNHIKIILDAEEYIPLGHKKDDEILDLPPSLYDALNSFIIVRAIRNIRGHRNKHCSMMVNISRFVNYQKQVENLLNFQVQKIRQAVLSNIKLPDYLALRNSYVENLKLTFDEEYINVGVTWNEIKAELPKVFSNFKTFLINSESSDALDFSLYDKQETGLTALAVGGLSLSRGLTIEGLTISYLYRNTKMYDTLMQMGRWFGYRPNYEDLCRVYLSSDSYNWYAHIAEASKDLIDQVKEMTVQGRSPKDFGLIVKSHPDSLLVTAKNKMLSAEEITVQQSYGGLLRETHKVSLDSTINKHNFDLIKEFWKADFYSEPLIKETVNKGYFYKNISLDIIEKFLIRFKVHAEYKETFGHVIKYLREAREKGIIPDLGDVLLISPKNGFGGKEPFTLRSQLRRIDKTQYENQGVWALSRSRVAGVGDEKYGLTEDELSKAHKLFGESESSSKSISDVYYRSARGRVLLMLHSLLPTIDGEPQNEDEPVSALGISFPPQSGDKELVTIEVIANRVWLEQEYNLSSLDEVKGDLDEE